MWLQAVGEVGRPTKGKGALKPYLLLFLFRKLLTRHFFLFLLTIEVQYLPQDQH